MLGVVRLRAIAQILLSRIPAGASEEEVRAADRHRRAAWTTLSALFSRAVQIVTNLLSVSLTIEYLGKERYGLWVAVSSFVATLSFADLGLGNGLINLVAEAHGSDDRVAARTAVSSATAALVAVASALLLALLVATVTVNWAAMFHVTGALAVAEARPAVFATGLIFVLNIPLGIAQRVQTGRQEGYATNAWQLAGNILSLVGLVVAAALHLGLPLLAVAVTGTSLLTTAANAVQVFGFGHVDLRPSPRFASYAVARRLLRLGLQFLVMQVCIGVVYSSDALILAHVRDASVVAQYAVSSRLMNVQAMLLGMAVAPLWPAYAEASARGDVAWIRRTLGRSLVLSTLAWLSASTLLLLAGPWIVAVWTHRAVSTSRGLLLALAGWNGCIAVGGAMSIFLNAMSALRIQVLTSVAMTVVGTLARILLCRAFGTVGMVWGTTLSYLVLVMIPVAMAVVSELSTLSERARGADTSTA